MFFFALLQSALKARRNKKFKSKLSVDIYPDLVEGVDGWGISHSILKKWFLAWSVDDWIIEK